MWLLCPEKEKVDVPLNTVLIVSTLVIVIIVTVFITLLRVGNAFLIIATIILIILTINRLVLGILSPVLTTVPRFCKMTIKPGAQYCGEHAPLPATEHDLGQSLLIIICRSS